MYSPRAWLYCMILLLVLAYLVQGHTNIPICRPHWIVNFKNGVDRGQMDGFCVK